MERAIFTGHSSHYKSFVQCQSKWYHWLLYRVHLLGRIKHCTIAAFIVLGLVTYLGVIGCTSKQVLSPSSHLLTANPYVVSCSTVLECFPMYQQLCSGLLSSQKCSRPSWCPVQKSQYYDTTNGGEHHPGHCCPPSTRTCKLFLLPWYYDATGEVSANHRRLRYSCADWAANK